MSRNHRYLSFAPAIAAALYLVLPAAPTPGRADASDRDGDGLPDAWEVAHGLNPDDGSDAVLDPDRDGFNNLQEFLAGTDLRDSQSVLKFEITPSTPGWNGSLMIRFQAVPGKSYSVQYRDSISDGPWRKLADIAPAANHGLVELADRSTSGSSARFYRLVTPLDALGLVVEWHRVC